MGRCRPHRGASTADNQQGVGFPCCVPLPGLTLAGWMSAAPAARGCVERGHAASTGVCGCDTYAVARHPQDTSNPGASGGDAGLCPACSPFPSRTRCRTAPLWQASPDIEKLLQEHLVHNAGRVSWSPLCTAGLQLVAVLCLPKLGVPGRLCLDATCAQFFCLAGRRPLAPHAAVQRGSSRVGDRGLQEVSCPRT